MKKYLFDTSVLVAAVLQKHPAHEKSFPWLSAAVSGKIGFFMSSHALAELFAVLTGMPSSPKISPAQAKFLIEKDLKKAKIVELAENDYRSILASMADLNLYGGIIYDALSAYSAKKAGADYILTLNPKDFLKFQPLPGFPEVVSPHDKQP